MLIWAPYHARLWSGRSTEATVSGLRHYTSEDSDGDTVHHYEVTAAEQALGTLVDEVDHDDYEKLQVGMVIPWRVVPWKVTWERGWR